MASGRGLRGFSVPVAARLNHEARLVACCSCAVTAHGVAQFAVAARRATSTGSLRGVTDSPVPRVSCPCGGFRYRTRRLDLTYFRAGLTCWMRPPSRPRRAQCKRGRAGSARCSTPGLEPFGRALAERCPTNGNWPRGAAAAASGRSQFRGRAAGAVPAAGGFCVPISTRRGPLRAARNA